MRGPTASWSYEVEGLPDKSDMDQPLPPVPPLVGLSQRPHIDAAHHWAILTSGTSSTSLPGAARTTKVAHEIGGDATVDELSTMLSVSKVRKGGKNDSRYT